MSGKQQQIIPGIRRAWPVEFALKLKFDDCVVAVRSNSGNLVQTLSGYFRSFATDTGDTDILITVHQAPPPDFDIKFEQKAPDAGKLKIKEEYADTGSKRIVRKRLTGMVFIFGDGEHLAIGPCEQNANQVINFINNRYIEWKLHQAGLLGHAAAVVQNGTGIALAGFSGMGKSTLALHLLGKGLDFVSNDRLVIRKAGGEGIDMFGIAKHPRVNPGTILGNPDIAGIISEEMKMIYRNLPPAELWSLEQKYDASIDDIYGSARFVLKAKMKGLVILNWQRIDAPCTFEIIDIRQRKDLLSAFMKETGLFFQPGPGMAPPGPEDYLSALSGCSVIEIAGGIDFDAAAGLCLDFMGG